LEYELKVPLKKGLSILIASFEHKRSDHFQ
jgi:hypothetical protein